VATKIRHHEPWSGTSGDFGSVQYAMMALASQGFFGPPIGGDPMIMKTKTLRAHLAPLLAPELDHVQTLRIGSKSLAYWPQRFVSDADADDLMRLFEEVASAGRHLALMAHYSHPRELSTPVSRTAVERVQATGAVVRTQDTSSRAMKFARSAMRSSPRGPW